MADLPPCDVSVRYPFWPPNLPWPPPPGSVISFPNGEQCRVPGGNSPVPQEVPPPSVPTTYKPPSGEAGPAGNQNYYLWGFSCWQKFTAGAASYTLVYSLPEIRAFYPEKPPVLTSMHFTSDNRYLTWFENGSY